MKLLLPDIVRTFIIPKHGIATGEALTRLLCIDEKNLNYEGDKLSLTTVCILRLQK